MIIGVEKMPIDKTCAEFWKVWFIAPPALRSPVGRLFITPARFGDANAPIESPPSALKNAYEIRSVVACWMPDVPL